MGGASSKGGDKETWDGVTALGSSSLAELSLHGRDQRGLWKVGNRSVKTDPSPQEILLWDLAPGISEPLSEQTVTSLGS